MKYILNFFKQNNKWYADVPNHSLEDNEMIFGSDILLDELSSNGNKLSMEFYDEEVINILHAKMVEHDEDGAKIVLSSSWRYWDLKTTVDSYKGTALDPLLKYLVGVTAGSISRFRGKEIEDFLDIVKSGFGRFEGYISKQELSTLHCINEQIESYAIVDDDNDMTDYQKENCFVQTDFMVGLTIEDCNKIKEILNKK